MGTLTSTITTTPQQDARIAAAYGRQLNLTDEQGAPHNATGPEVKAAVIDFIRQTVIRQERRAAIEAIQDNTFDPS
jgi:hypothetical protein